MASTNHLPNSITTKASFVQIFELPLLIRQPPAIQTKAATTTRGDEKRSSVFPPVTAPHTLHNEAQQAQERDLAQTCETFAHPHTEPDFNKALGVQSRKAMRHQVSQMGQASIVHPARDRNHSQLLW